MARRDEARRALTEIVRAATEPEEVEVGFLVTRQVQDGSGTVYERGRTYTMSEESAARWERRNVATRNLDDPRFKAAADEVKGTEAGQVDPASLEVGTYHQVTPQDAPGHRADAPPAPVPATAIGADGTSAGGQTPRDQGRQLQSGQIDASAEALSKPIEEQTKAAEDQQKAEADAAEKAEAKAARTRRAATDEGPKGK